MFSSTDQTATNDEAVIQTTFQFDPREHTNSKVGGLHFDLGGYEPSREEILLAPFYLDTSQRLIVVELLGRDDLFVIRAETLLRMARERGGVDLRWEEWRTHVIRVRYEPNICVYNLWVSGVRLFCIHSTTSQPRNASMDVYDFSAQGSARYTETTQDGVVQRFVRPSRTRVLRWVMPDIGFAGSGHDCVVVVMVTAIPCSSGQIRN